MFTFSNGKANTRDIVFSTICQARPKLEKYNNKRRGRRTKEMRYFRSRAEIKPLLSRGECPPWDLVYARYGIFTLFKKLNLSLSLSLSLSFYVRPGVNETMFLAACLPGFRCSLYRHEELTGGHKVGIAPIDQVCRNPSRPPHRCAWSFQGQQTRDRLLQLPTMHRHKQQGGKIRW